MSIKRRGPLPAERFTIIPNAWIRDERLSFRARGVLAYLLSHTDRWETSVAKLSESGAEGRDAIQTTILELEEIGYLTREQMHSETGQFLGVDYVLQMADQAPGTVDGKPVDGKTVTGKTVTGKSATKKTIPIEDQQTEDQPSSSPLRADVEAMLDFLDEQITAAAVRRPPHRTKANRDAARLMLDRDGYDRAEIAAVIRWATHDGFWAANIGSAVKLRAQYQTLRAQMNRHTTRRRGGDIDWEAAFERAAARDEAMEGRAL